MIDLYEASLKCSYCGSRLVHKLRPDEVAGLGKKRSLTRLCDFCGGMTEWTFIEWRGAKPAQSVLDGKVTAVQDEEPEPRPPDRILVIDDDDLTAILLRKVLETENIVMEIANDGKEALQKLMGTRYALVICDIHMPEMDGKKLFRFIDEHALESKNMIMFITGDTSVETRKFLENTGCHYMHKPIQILQFASRVREILDYNREAHGEG